MTKQIMVGGVPVGGGAPVSIQSMCNTFTHDVDATVRQIDRLAAAGCDIVRVAVPDMAAAKAIGKIKERISIPLVVDIHFDYRLALEAIAAGADKVRINPGNIGGEDRVKAVANACANRGIPIRIGVNGGSLEKPLLAKYGKVCPEALVESAFGHIALLNKYDFDDICVSLKSSNVPIAMEAYRMMHERSHYPLHLGVTEAGTYTMGTIKSAIGIGGLLAQGVGDTFRVTLTADPADEIVVAAPYWDLSYPAALRTYIEHISVVGLTYHYEADGCHGDCRAGRLVYLTTGGDFEQADSVGVLHWRQLCTLFGIPRFDAVFAGGLDAAPDRTEEQLAAGCARARQLAEEF